MDEKTAAQAQMLANRLKKRYRHLRKWAQRSGTAAFRLYDRDIPEIPLVLDLYDDVISGALYQRPYEKDETEEALWLQAMRSAIASGLEIDRDSVIIKRRRRQYGKAQYEKIDSRGFTRIIGEGGLKFKVNLSDYLDTGLFLDRRAMRSMVRSESRDRRMLNLFCYTAAFSVYAADGGAASTDSVDLSNTYLTWARDNFALNGYCTQTVTLEGSFSQKQANAGNSRVHRLIRADVLEFLRKAALLRHQWDLIILDPPAFSNSAMARTDFDLQRDLHQLLNGCLALLSPGGKLVFASGSRSLKTSAAGIEIMLTEHFPGVKVSDISSKLTDEDFRSKKPPKAFLVDQRM